MSIAPWMPLWVGDYRADTGQLTQSQHGAYLLLIMEYWQSGPLPDDNQVLARVSLSDSPATWLAMRSAMKRFFIVRDGYWHHKRIDIELEKAKKALESKRKGANLTNSKRWGTSLSESLSESDSDPLSESLSVSPPSPSPSPSPSPEPQNQIAYDAILNQCVEVPTSRAATKKINGEPKTTQAGQWAGDLRRRGMDVSSQHPTLLAWIKDGFTLPQAIEALEIAREKKPNERIHANYIDPILRNPPKESQASWWTSEQSIQAKGAEFGLSARPGEDWEHFKARIQDAIKHQRTAAN